jgi:hypothetical protein
VKQSVAAIEKRISNRKQRFMFILCHPLYSMFKFLLIFPTPALEKNFDPQNTPCIPAVNFFSALDLNKFPKNLNIELYVNVELNQPSGSSVVTIQQPFKKMAKSPFCSFPIFFGSFLAFCH